MDRHELNGAEPPIDSSNKLIHCRSEVLIFLHVLTRRHRKLNKHKLKTGDQKSLPHRALTDFADPFWVLCKEQLHRMELLGNSLNVIEAIYTNDDLHSTKSLLQLVDAVLDGLLS